jgi:hypothetical protein
MGFREVCDVAVQGPRDTGDEIDALNFASKSISASGMALFVFRLL